MKKLLFIILALLAAIGILVGFLAWAAKEIDQ